MKVWELCLFFVFLQLGSSRGEDTVAEDIGVHQLQRLVEMLTSTECDDLLFTLSHPEENIFQHLERLAPENNQLDLKPRAKRDASSSQDREAECRAALTDWLLRYGEQTYYDRLSRALQHIGRTDIAIEVGKNINQDKALSLKRFVEDYHKYVQSLNPPQEQSDATGPKKNGQRVRKRKVRDLTWGDLDLIVQRAPVSAYQKGPLDVALPLLYGILLGFGGTFVVGVTVLLIILHISRRSQKRHHSKSSVGDSKLKDAGRSDAAK
ncbi:transmembrane and death domain protein 1-like [Eleginops maclovinus]|uniref:transmembrane and death domain protein 1-like n=1 Tax=Eleginops maclovinus TaxID=56733 RepID=UPI00307FD3B5